MPCSRKSKARRAVVFVQDYHFALLPRFVKDARPDITVCQFWHIPWPNRESFRVCPWGEQILQGLLGNDLLAFHIQYHCNNFLDTVDRALESRVDYEHFAVWRGGRPTLRQAVSDQHRSGAVGWTGQGRRSSRRSEGDAPRPRRQRRALDLRRRSTRLHEGHSRSAQGVRPAARTPSGLDRAGDDGAGRRAEPRSPRALSGAGQRSGRAGGRDQRALRDRRVAADRLSPRAPRIRM